MSFQPDFTKISESPGIYLMKNKSGEIIYIGKAKNLRNRVRSYFQAKGNLTYKTAVLVDQIADIETLETTTEAEALITESNYVKKHLPKYNILLKDGKHIPFVQVTTSELFPRLKIVRKPKNDKNLYFGPYTSGTEIKYILKSIYKLFPVRQSKDVLDGVKTRRPCLNYQMNQCFAPCAGKISPEEYSALIKQVILFLKGKYKELISRLEEEMLHESQKQNYEKAGQCRDRIQMVKKHLENQAVYSANLETRDAVGLYIKDDITVVQILSFFSGKLSGNRDFIINSFSSNDPQEILSEALRRYYFDKSTIPSEILIPFDFDDRKELEEYLTEKLQRKTKLIVPERGLKNKILKLAAKNAESIYENKINNADKIKQELKSIQKILRLKNLPRLIEGFDISNLGDTITASHVSFVNLKPDKKLYRNYKMKSVKEQDDYLSMQEVITRRIRRIIDDHLPIPDLLIIDGGKGHLGVVENLLINTFPEIYKNIDIIGIAKKGSHSKIITDEIILTNGKSVDVKEFSAELRTVLQVRDEVHRVAVTFLRTVNRKKNLFSELDEIKGIGEKRKILLLKTFGSLERIKQETVESLYEKCHIPEKIAVKILTKA
ncbi:MAG: excinuclease ABC subunit UvrC [Nitrospinae bacterium]|nr:excinuclease ABC subunit UvrC [Nitrospinota bacterium]